MTIQYIIVAESTRAKVLAFDKEAQEFEEVYDFIHPEGRRGELEINSDKSGRRKGGNIATIHSVDSKHRSKSYEGSVFAGEISSQLDADRVKEKYDGLVLIAPPHFLGELRDKLSTACNDLVDKSINKNLLHCSEKELLEHLAK